MTLLHEAVEAKKIDVRMIERNLIRGVITSTEADAHTKGLPDDAANAEYVSIQSLMDDDSEANSSY